MGPCVRSDPSATFTPRVVVGVGHGIEVGLNFDGLAAPDVGSLEISPTVKWRIWNDADAGWSFYVGDDLFFPATMRTYDVGNYGYAVVRENLEVDGTRVGFGAYDFTQEVVARGNRAGGQFTFEQTIGEAGDAGGGVVHGENFGGLRESGRDVEADVEADVCIRRIRLEILA